MISGYTLRVDLFFLGKKLCHCGGGDMFCMIGVLDCERGDAPSEPAALGAAQRSSI